MQNMSITIELRRPRSVISFRRWGVSISEVVCETGTGGILQLKATSLVEPHELSLASAAKQLCDQENLQPVIIPIAEADSFLTRWRTKEPTNELIVVPLAIGKLFWNVLRDFFDCDSSNHPFGLYEWMVCLLGY